MTTDRRKFLEIMGAGALATVFSESIQRALAIPAHRCTGTLQDVEHIVILMQENRSFDHYFGTLRGVRGFGDPRAAKLPSGKPVWFQPDGAHEVLPFRPESADLGLAFLEGTPHNWSDTQGMWNGGKYDQWIPFKGRTSMVHFKREDIPFHFALADAFTVCDAYHCSFMGATDPNRYHLWTGWVGNDGKNGGPVLDNSEAGYDWKTYPERLLEHGISRKLYQDAGAGLDGPNYWGWGSNPYIGNYGDNSLLYFHQYQNSAPGSALHTAAFNATNISAGGTLFDQFRADVASGKLPQVSWIVAPEAYSEHPNWPANYGAWYVSQVLNALTANPEVWSKTAFFLMFDENDGFFDHVVPPTPHFSPDSGASNIDTVNEVFAGNERFTSGPIGLGQRVPMIVISPWSKGGWVNSQVFDHTSLIRFIERRFGVMEPNITPWRRAITGDLTSAFDFRVAHNDTEVLPDTASYAPPDYDFHPDFSPLVPASQSVPKQEPGVRPARALPYRLNVESDLNCQNGELALTFQNTGSAAAVFQVRSEVGTFGPWSYTVNNNSHLSHSWKLEAGKYALSVHGPNGFFREYQGDVDGECCTNINTRFHSEKRRISLEIENCGSKSVELLIWDAYGRDRSKHHIAAGRTLVWRWSLEHSFGWYDLSLRVEGDANFMQRLAGHVEDGHPSMSDPAFGV